MVFGTDVPDGLPRFVPGTLRGQAAIRRSLSEGVVHARVHELEHMRRPKPHVHPALQHGRLRDALPLHVRLGVHASRRDRDNAVHVREITVMGLNS